MQMFELLLAVVGSSRFNKAIQPVVPEMAYTCVAYMQVSQSQFYLTHPSEAVCTYREYVWCMCTS